MPEAPPPTPSAWPLLAVPAAVMCVFAAAVWAHWPWLERAVAMEEAPVAWLQSSMLWLSAGLTVLLASTEPGRRSGWWLLALGLTLAALDERFMGHERLTDWLLFEGFGGDLAAMGLWGDAPMLAYAAAGLLALAWLWRGTPRFLGRAWLAAALVAGGLALALDIATTRLQVQVLEEALELLAETLFACALLRHAQLRAVPG